jgi:DNA-binding transcriptional LysR family regulator
MTVEQLDLLLLRSFAVAAQEGHVGRAAVQLGVAQPTLTRRLQALEEQVGALLLERLPHGVAPTAAGRALLDEAPRRLSGAERALDRVRRAAAGGEGVVAIGFIPSAARPVLGPVLAELRAQAPGAAVTVVERAWAEQIAGLASGADDVALVRDLDPDAPWAHADLFVEDLCIVLPAGHPFARLDRIDRRRLRSLADAPFITSRSWAASRQARFGFLPQVTHDVVSLAGLLALVETGAGVSLAPVSYAAFAPDGVRFVPIAGERSVQQVAWVPGREHPLRDRVVAIAQAVVGRIRGE